MPSFFRFLGSLRSAIFLIGGLAAILTFSTLIESAHGTPMVQRFFYRAGWFDVFLSLLAVNIFCSTLTRWPFKKYHTGFVVTHIGILTLLAGSLLARWGGIEGQLPLFESETGSRIQLEGHELTIFKPDHRTLKYPVRKIFFNRTVSHAIADTPYRVLLEDIRDNAVVTTEIRNGGKDTPLNAAVSFRLESETIGLKESYRLIEKNPYDASSHELNVGPAVFEIRKKEKTRSEKSGASLLFHPGNPWTYTATSKNAVTEGVLSEGVSFSTGWMDFKVLIDNLWDHAVVEKRVGFGSGGKAGVKISLELEGHPVDSRWLLADEPEKVETPDGVFLLSLSQVSAPVPFRLTLKDFRKVDYPGTANAASFESDVRLEDPHEHVTIEKTISMNKPFDYRGYRIFQSSFAQSPRFGEMSVFTVAKNPGIGLIYAGAVIIFTGAALVFYVKPFSYLSARRNYANKK